MNKLFHTFCFFLMMGSFFLTISSAFAEEVGVVDIQKVLVESDAGKEAQKKLTDKQKELEGKLQKKAEELNELKGKSKGKKEVSAAKVAEKEAELQVLQNDIGKEFQEFNAKTVNELKTQVDNVLLNLQKEKKLSMILDKRAVLVGGKDITDEVIHHLSKK